MANLLIYLLIIIIIFGAIAYALRVIPIDQPFKNIAYLIILVIFILVLLGLIGIIPGWPGARPLLGPA